MTNMELLEELADILQAVKPEWDIEVCPEPKLAFLTIITENEEEFDLSVNTED